MTFSIGLNNTSPGQGWQSEAIFSLQEKGAIIHAGSEFCLDKIQLAARQLAALPLSELSLEGEAWTLARQWAFYRGYVGPKTATKIQWASLPEADEKELKDRILSFSWAKEVVNETPEVISPEALADRARSLIEATAGKVEVERLSGEDLIKAGYPGVYQVGRGSTRPPVMLKVLYTPSGKEDSPIDVALVGKGITFDSGGYSIKASASMFSMKADMAGAATVTAALDLAIKRGLNKKVLLILCCAENLVSGHAYKLGDIIEYKNGTRVEIANTDAEGRLVLADGLIAASEAGAKVIIDAATLTGAAGVAVGSEYNALFSQDQALSSDLLELASAVSERTWQLPLDDFHRDNCPSQFADTANSRTIKGGGAAGASNAAGFLSRFVGDGIPWAHFDISAAYNENANARCAAGASGQGILTIAEYLCR